MDTQEKREILRTIQLKPGLNSLHRNLSAVLNALWKIADENKAIPYYVYKPFAHRLEKYINELNARASIHVYKGLDGSHGRIALWTKRVRSARAKCEKQKRTKEIGQKKQKATTLSRKKKGGDTKKASAQKLQLPSRCLVFVDVPNVFGRNLQKNNGSNSEARNDFNFNWTVLQNVVSRIIRPTRDVPRYFAYLKVPKGFSGVWGQRIKSGLMRAGFDVRTCEKKDVDPLLITDIILETLPYLQKGRIVKVVLVSGDSDYVYPLKRLQAVARKKEARLSIYALAWRGARSLDLYQSKAVNHIYALDSFSRLLYRSKPADIEEAKKHTQHVA